MEKFWPLFLAAAAGALMAIQGSLNTALSKPLGLIPGTFIVHIVGTITSGIVLLCCGQSHFDKAGEVPWFGWLGGILGVLIVIGVSASFTKLGAGTATTAIVAIQLLVAYCIDQFGWLGMEKIAFDYWKIIGIILIAAGSKILLC